MRSLLHSCFALSIATLIGLTTMTCAAQNNAASIHTVAYVDVLPIAAEGARATFKRYRDAAGKEPGNLQIELLEQVSYPARFVVLEAWEDVGSLQAHAVATANSQLQNSLEAVRISSYDQRSYRALYDAIESHSFNPEAIVAVTHVDIGGPARDSGEALKQFALDSRKDDGNLGTAVLQGETRNNHFTLLSVWKDLNAYAAHRAVTHTRTFHSAIEPLTGSPLDERLYKIIQ